MFLGTCSWKYPSWHGLVYSEHAERNYLAEYSKKFRTVEIDQWFWSLFPPGKSGIVKPRLPEVATADEYSQSVDSEFRFSIKVPNSVTLTHFYRKDKEGQPVVNPRFLSPELLSEFLTRIGALRPQTLALMLQFEYLNRQKMSSLSGFLEKLGTFADRLPDAWPFAVEVRNPNYLRAELFSFLEERGIAPVFCEGYYMPPITQVYAEFGHLVKRSAIIRLMGPDREGIEKKTSEKWDRVVASKDDYLPEIAEMMRDMVRRGLQVVVNVNNH
ncbi:MAG TPA: DUF72 domain-containing protein [Spirochaetia bacterium]|nr:DUF72 domain-containing protein [Spirochaetia bacterium]